MCFILGRNKIVQVNFSPILSYFSLQVLDLVKGMHYQLACQKYFELTHNVSGLFVKLGVTMATGRRDLTSFEKLASYILEWCG